MFELGIGLFEAARGKGYGTDVIVTVARYLFEEEGAIRVQLGTDVRNAAMRRSAEKAGYRFEGVMRSFWEVPGEAPHDYAMYARTRTDHEGGDDGGEGRSHRRERHMDPNKLTIKARAALEGAHAQALARNQQEILPEHVLFALLSDPEGVVYPAAAAARGAAEAAPRPRGGSAGPAPEGLHRRSGRAAVLDRDVAAAGRGRATRPSS